MVNAFKPLNKGLNVLITLVIFMVSFLCSRGLAGVFGINEMFVIIPFLLLISIVSDKCLIVQVLIICVILFIWAIAKYMINMREFTTLLDLFKEFVESEKYYFAKFVRQIKLALNTEVLTQGLKYCAFGFAVRISGLFIKTKKGRSVS